MEQAMNSVGHFKKHLDPLWLFSTKRNQIILGSVFCLKRSDSGAREKK
jgi:hypothetical protein